MPGGNVVLPMGDRAGRKSTWSYHVYGVGIRSALKFPELSPCSSAIDARVRVDQVEAPDEVRLSELSVLAARDGTFYCGGAKIGAMAVRAGTEIVIDPADPRADERLLRYAVLGPALRALLHQRGLLVLHASVVVIGGRGVAFVGDNGAGKSTVAAASLSYGQRV